MNELTWESTIKWLRNLANTYEENKDHLTKLDKAIGDADHGVNMTRGFKAVQEKLADMGGEILGKF